MFEEMKQKIITGLKQIDAKGDQAIAKKVRAIVRDAVEAEIAKSKGDGSSTEEVAKQAAATSVGALGESGAANPSCIVAVVDGVMDGVVSQEERNDLEQAWNELSIAKARLQRKQETLGDRMRDTLSGVDKSIGTFSGETKKHLDAAVQDMKRKHAEVLGLTRTNAAADLKQRARVAAATMSQRMTVIRRTGGERAAKATEVSKRAAHATAEELKELATKTLAITKGALSGMREGAREALERNRGPLGTGENPPRVGQDVAKKGTQETGSK